MAGPLEGVKILELTAVVLGPWACQMLADMGAEVIHIEPPGGDSTRRLRALAPATSRSSTGTRRASPST